MNDDFEARIAARGRGRGPWMVEVALGERDGGRFWLVSPGPCRLVDGEGLDREIALRCR